MNIPRPDAKPLQILLSGDVKSLANVFPSSSPNICFLDLYCLTYRQAEVLPDWKRMILWGSEVIRKTASPVLSVTRNRRVHVCKHMYSEGCLHPSHFSKEVSGDQDFLIRTIYFWGQQTVILRPIETTTCFCLTQELGMFFTFLNIGGGGGKNTLWHAKFLWRRNFRIHKSSFIGNTAMLICSYIVLWLLPLYEAKLSRCNRDSLAHKA